MAESILVVSSVVNFYNSILPLLEKHDCNKVQHAVSIADAKRVLMTEDISALIINCPLNDGFGLDFAIRLSSEKNYAVLAFVSNEFYEKASEKCAEHTMLILPKPTSSEIISNTLKLLLSTAQKMRSINTKKKESSSASEEIRILGRAKLILIRSFGMTEDQSHKYIEQRAMESRKQKTEIAQNIITAYGNR